MNANKNEERANAENATGTATKTFHGKVKEIIPANDGKNVVVVFCSDDDPEHEIRIVGPKMQFEDNSLFIVDSVAKTVNSLEKLDHESFRAELVEIGAAFFAQREDWSITSRFRMKENLWACLCYTTEAIEIDGANVDPELLETALQAIEVVKTCEGECLYDLDELKERIWAAQDRMRLAQKRNADSDIRLPEPKLPVVQNPKS